LLYIAAPVEQYCDITQVNALPENEGILEALYPITSHFYIGEEINLMVEWLEA